LKKKIYVPEDVYAKLETKARAEGLTPEELTERIIVDKAVGYKRLKPPFKAEKNQLIICPKVQNEVSVDADCHGWALRDELCHFAESCPPYLNLLIQRINEDKPVNPKVLEKLGIDRHIVKELGGERR